MVQHEYLTTGKVSNRSIQMIQRYTRKPLTTLIVWLSLPVLKGLLMRVHYPKLRNIVHPISLLMFLLLSKDQTFIFYLT